MNQLPAIFSGIGEVSFVRQVTPNEFHSSCPSCGGVTHEDGSYPDRFVMWIASRVTGLPFGLCRKCGYKWTPNKSDAKWTDEERREFRRKAEEVEREYFIQKALELQNLADRIEEQGFYKDYYQAAQKSTVALRYYESIGVPPSWQEYLQKGFIPQYTVHGQNSTYQDSAYTFPVWTLGGKIENIKLRVANPRSSNDRYRNVYKSGCQHLYIPIRADRFSNSVLIMEGEKKADCVEIYRKFSKDIQVVGVQSSMPERRILRELRDSDVEVFYLAFDPDAYVVQPNGTIPVVSTARFLGEKRCRYVIPPKDTKFDDAILLGFRFENALNMAVQKLD